MKTQLDGQDVPDSMDVESIDDQALCWVMRMTSGDADPAMLQELERWRSVSPEHARALDQARQLWLGLGPALETRYDPVMVSRGRLGRAWLRTRPRWRVPMALAASLLLTAGLGQQWLSNWRHDQVTAVGEQKTVALADGSTMWLNTGSAADLQIDGSRRHVRLVRGEAFFDVQHDAVHPFTVDAGRGQIQVLGTAFAVHREGDDVVVTVQRGRVQVSGGGSPPLVITRDERVRVAAGATAKQVERVDADEQLSWRSGQLLFVGRPLSEVIDELRRYDRRLLLVSRLDASDIHVSAMIDLARLDEWFDGLEQSLPVSVTRAGPVVLIHGKQA